MKRLIKYQKKEIIFPVGTTAGVKTESVDFDRAYQLCDGVTVYERAGGGVPFWELGLSDDDLGTYVDTVESKFFKDQGRDERFLEVSIANNKRPIRISVNIPEVLTSDLKFQMIFRLKNTENL
ncbi:hypothetical protein [Flexithrix dorotheae]|uniref:hypothetical protein n=1 Tax=Flexithrix dorotheae TaxID=70993 RepID=UPI0003781175|nr:hypothetical protein [Flexithrix dorotheae]